MAFIEIAILEAEPATAAPARSPRRFNQPEQAKGGVPHTFPCSGFGLTWLRPLGANCRYMAEKIEALELLNGRTASIA